MQPKAKSKKETTRKKTQMQNTRAKWAFHIYTIENPCIHTHREILIYYPSNITVTNYIKNIHTQKYKTQSKQAGRQTFFPSSSSSLLLLLLLLFYISIFGCVYPQFNSKIYTFIFLVVIVVVVIVVLSFEMMTILTYIQTMNQNIEDQDHRPANQMMMILEPTKHKRFFSHC